MRLCAQSALFTLAIAALIGEVFKSTDEERYGVSLLVYLLLPAIAATILILADLRIVQLRDIEISKLRNKYQLELKARGLWEKPEEFQEFFRIASEKLPSEELLYLWWGLGTLHFNNGHIKAIILCFKGLKIARNLDTKYMFFHFRVTSQLLYKQSIEDDAYYYKLFNQLSVKTQALHSSLSQVQYEFWSKLATEIPSLQKLQQLAKSCFTYYYNTKQHYKQLLQINEAEIQTLHGYSNLLRSINSSKASGYKSKAMQLEYNPILLIDELSYFSKTCAVLSISSEVGRIGEILDTNIEVYDIFKYSSSEIIGRNIAMLFPSHLLSQEVHDGYMMKFYERTEYKVLQKNHKLYFMRKDKYVIKAETHVRVVPNGDLSPFFLALIRPISMDEGIVLLSEQFKIVGVNESMKKIVSNKYDYDNKITNYIANFNEIKDEIMRRPVHDVVLYGDCVKGQSIEIPRFTTTSQQAQFKSYIVVKVTAYMRLFAFPPIQAYELSLTNIQRIEDVEYGDNGSSSSSDDINWSSVSTPYQQISSDPLLRQVSKVEGKEMSIIPEEDETYYRPSYNEGFDEPVKHSNSQQGRNQLSVQEGQEESGQDSETVSEDLQSDESGSEESGSDESDQSSEEASEDEKEESEEDKSYMASFIQEEEPSENSSKQSGNQNFNAASMNSSTILVKNINTVVKKEINLSKTKARRLKVHLILIALTLITLFLVVTTLQEQTVNTYRTEANLILDAGIARTAVISMAYQVRSLLLNPSLPNTELLSYTLDLHEANYVMRQAGSIQEPTDVPLWFQFDTLTTEKRFKLYAAIELFALQGKILARGPIQQWDTRTFLLYRNGIGELYQTINATVDEMQDDSVARVDDIFIFAIVFLSVQLALGLTLVVFLIAPGLIWFQRSKEKVWKILLEVPIEICQQIKESFSLQMDLLNEFKHGNVAAISEQTEAGQGQQNQRIVQRKLKKFSFKMSRAWLGVPITIICLTNIAVSILQFYIGYNLIEGPYRMECVHHNWTSRRVNLVMEISFWAREIELENEANSYYKLVPEDQLQSSPQQYMKRIVDELRVVENGIINGDSENGIESTYLGLKHKELQFTNACSSEPCPIAMRQGLHSAVLYYIDLAYALTLTSDPQSISSLSKEIFDLETMHLTPSLTHAIELYEEEFNNIKDLLWQWELIVIWAYTILSIILLIFVQYPIINSISQSVQHSWHMILYIPSEDTEKLKCLYNLIEECKDILNLN